jgi:hypothetical protein
VISQGKRRFPKEYVCEKMQLTELQPRDNKARFFLAALRQDFKMPVRHVPMKKAKIKREPVPEPVVSEEERQVALEQLREWRRKSVALGPAISTFFRDVRDLNVSALPRKSALSAKY